MEPAASMFGRACRTEPYAARGLPYEFCAIGRRACAFDPITIASQGGGDGRRSDQKTDPLSTRHEGERDLRCLAQDAPAARHSLLRMQDHKATKGAKAGSLRARRLSGFFEFAALFVASCLG